MGEMLKFPDRSGVLKLKRRKRRAPLPTTSGCTARPPSLQIFIQFAAISDMVPQIRFNDFLLESPHDLDAAHWEHELTPNPSQERN